MSTQANHLSRSTNRGLPSMPVLRCPLRPSRGRRPARLGATGSGPAPRPVLTRAAMPAALSIAAAIEAAIGQWIDANPPQLYRGGA